MTYEKFLAAFKSNWQAYLKRVGRAPTVICVGLDRAAENVRRCLNDLNLDAHIFVDPEASENRILFTDETSMADMPGNVVHSAHGHLLGGGKN